MKVFISGVSRGIGLALATHYSKDHSVYGISRSSCDLAHVYHSSIDLSELDQLKSRLHTFLNQIDKLDMVFLNAAILGKIQRMQNADLAELKKTMDINLWAQKLILDTLLEKEVTNIIAISSGAAVKGSLGWSGYSLSKASLNMLIQLYASEFPKTKFIALAPGLIDTHMQDEISKEDANEFPNLRRLQEAKKEGTMQTPSTFVKNFLGKQSKILECSSGSFIDMRDID